MSSDYHQKLQTEFADKLLAIQDEARQLLSPMAWFLLTSALCSLGETSVTVLPSLSHSHSTIDGLGPTYKDSLARLPDRERSIIQSFYRQFVDSLSYGRPSHLDLRD